MKFSCSVKIFKPREEVASYFFNPKYLHHFQDGFISKSLLSGVEGKKDAKSKMLYKKLTLIETIIYNNLPEEFYALYEHKNMTNTMKVTFNVLDSQSTQYISEIEYTELNGIIIKLIAKFFPSLFKKQVLKWMNQFKEFVESR